MPLQWLADFTGKARDGAEMSTKLIERVQDAKAPMPPVTTMLPMMSADHVTVLRNWVDAGMPGVEGRACEEGAVATDATRPAWANQPWPDGECEYTLKVGAHKTAGTPLAQDDEAFPLTSQQTNYYCFYEQVPWGDKKVQALATRVNVEGDDKQVVHHMVLSAVPPGNQMTLSGAQASGPGDHKPCDNPSGSTVGVWGPGPHVQVTFPKESGLLMPSGADAYLELQVHYNNAQAGMNSRVSFEICATSNVQPNTAAVHWLGYDNSLNSIVTEPLGPDAQPALDNQGGGVATGRCVAKERSRVLWIAPHMHQRGKHMKIEVLRASGMRETVLDQPFDFKEQSALFMEDLWVEQGETLQTTCTWDTSGGKIIFGHGSESEMCFAYALSYPIGGLAGEGAEKGTTGGDLNCAGVM